MDTVFTRKVIGILAIVAWYVMQFIHKFNSKMTVTLTFGIIGQGHILLPVVYYFKANMF